MTPREMFLKSFERPANYYTACPESQWCIDANLGILDWEGDGMDEPGDLERYKAHYGYTEVRELNLPIQD